MSQGGPGDLARSLSQLYGELEDLNNKIVNRAVNSVGVQHVREMCNENHNDLNRFSRLLAQQKRPNEDPLRQTVAEVTKNLRRTREAMGQLIEVLELHEHKPGRRRPADFERKHGALESEIEDLLLLLPALAEALYEEARRYGYVHRRAQISLRIDRGKPGNPGSATG